MALQPIGELRTTRPLIARTLATLVQGFATCPTPLGRRGLLTCFGLILAGCLAVAPHRVHADPAPGRAVHLPIFNYLGQEEICRTWIEAQNLGALPSKVILINWAAPGFCPPQAAGPLKVECSGLLSPGSTWNFQGSQIPIGAKSGVAFSFLARQFSEVGVDPGGFDDVIADYMCEQLFFGVIGDHDEYRRFKKAYDEGGIYGTLPLDRLYGSPLGIEVLRNCPGDITPTATVSAKYTGISEEALGVADPIFGGFGYYAPLVYAGKGGFDSVLYIQNGGIQCSSIEIWFKQQDDCLRNRICEVFTLAPGETFQFDAAGCVGVDWMGSAWLRSSQPMAMVVDLIGRDVLMSYSSLPAELRYAYEGVTNFRAGSQVAYGPLTYSEYQGWDTGIQVMNLSPVTQAKVKVYFLDRGGDIITTLVDWVCPRGSQTFYLPVIASLPGAWVGSVRVESQGIWVPGNDPIPAPDIQAVASLIRYTDASRDQTAEGIAYNLLPEVQSFDWQVGPDPACCRCPGPGCVAVIGIPSLLKDRDGAGMITELAVQNLVTRPGFTDYAMYIYDQNGLLSFDCSKLHDRQVEYIDLSNWGFIPNGFKGSAVISAVYWEHHGGGAGSQNLVALAAVIVERSGAYLGEAVPGDEAAGSIGFPIFDASFGFAPAPLIPRCPGQPTPIPPTPRPTITPTPSATSTATASATATQAPTATPTPTATATHTSSPSPTASFTPTIAPATATHTASPSPSATATPTSAPIAFTPTPTNSATATASATPTTNTMATAIAATLTAIAASPTPSPTRTPDLVATAVAATLTALVPSPTHTATPDLVATAVAATLTAIAQPSATVTASVAATSSATATSSVTASPSATHTLTATLTPTHTLTPATPTLTPATPTLTPATPTLSLTPTLGPTVTLTPALTVTLTATLTPTLTLTPTITPTLTAAQAEDRSDAPASRRSLLTPLFEAVARFFARLRD